MTYTHIVVGKRPRRSRAGFKIVESLIAMMVLAIAATAILRLHSTVFRGLATSGSYANALDIANQRAESIASWAVQNSNNVPTGCGILATQVPGCKANTKAFAVEGTGAVGSFCSPFGSGTFPCVDWLAGPAVSYVPGSAYTPSCQNGGKWYRVDTTVQDYNDLNQPQAKIVTVSVCWADATGDVQQVQTRRVVVPGV